MEMEIDKRLCAKDMMKLIQQSIETWHKDVLNRDPDYIIVTDDIRKIRPLNVHREDIKQVINELAMTNSEMWHEEDKVRSETDEVVLKAIRNINPLNQHRNDLMEEIDEIILDMVGKQEGGSK